MRRTQADGKRASPACMGIDFFAIGRHDDTVDSVRRKQLLERPVDQWFAAYGPEILARYASGRRTRADVADDQSNSPAIVPVKPRASQARAIVLQLSITRSSRGAYFSSLTEPPAMSSRKSRMAERKSSLRSHRSAR